MYMLSNGEMLPYDDKSCSVLLASNEFTIPTRNLGKVLRTLTQVQNALWNHYSFHSLGVKQ